MGCGSGRKESDAAQVREILGIGLDGACQVDVFDQGSAGLCAVGLPKFVAEALRIPTEEECAIDVGELCGEGHRASWTKVDITDPLCAGCGAVGLPQLAAVDAIVGSKKQHAAHVHQ